MMLDEHALAPRVASDAEGRVPVLLTIGVTGHIHLADPDAIRSTIDDVIDTILHRIPAIARQYLELVAVSALAEGADRLVAEEVLARDNARLEVVLPFALAAYEQDFAAAGSQAAFRDLLQQATTISDLGGDPTAGEPRDQAYLNAGMAVVDRSDIVIAVWDGQPAGGHGGTAEIVQYVRDSERPLVWVPTDGREPVLERVPAPGADDWTRGLGQDDLRGLRAYNQAKIDPRDFASLVSAHTRSLTDLVPAGSDLPVEPLAEWFSPPFVRSDDLATVWERRNLVLEGALYALAATAVSIVAFQIVWQREHRWWVSFEVLALFLVFLSWWIGRRLHVHERWISNRYLCERLRGAFFLALVGYEDSSLDLGGPADDPTTPWGARAFHSVWTRRPQTSVREDECVALRRFLAIAWIGDQHTFFVRTAEKRQRKHQRLLRLVYFLFGLSIVVALVHVSTEAETLWLRELISWLSITIPAWAAAIGGYLAQRDHHRHVIRYQQTAERLARLRAMMLRAPNLDEVRHVAGLVDQLMRQECGEWFGVVRLQDLELPA
jgi:SMODS and SLOG-associating 2TM effector domain 1